MKKLIALIIGLACVVSVTQAQTSSPSVIGAINTVVIDTNSTFFADQKFMIRSGVSQSDATAANFGGDINFGQHFQIGGDIVTTGGANVIRELEVNLAYRVPIHNIELDGIAGCSWNWDNNTAYARLGMRFSYSLTSRTLAYVQPELREDIKTFSRPSAQIQAGLGWSF